MLLPLMICEHHNSKMVGSQIYAKFYSEHSQKGKEATKHDKVFRDTGGGGDMWKEKKDEAR